LAIGIAPWLETKVIHEYGFGQLTNLFSLLGADSQSSVIMGVLVIAFLFAASHTVVYWIRGKDPGGINAFSLRLFMSVIFSLILFHISQDATIMVHAGYNTFALIFGLPLASIAGGNGSLENAQTWAFKLSDEGTKSINLEDTQEEISFTTVLQGLKDGSIRMIRDGVFVRDPNYKPASPRTNPWSWSSLVKITQPDSGNGFPHDGSGIVSANSGINGKAWNTWDNLTLSNDGKKAYILDQKLGVLVISRNPQTGDLNNDAEIFLPRKYGVGEIKRSPTFSPDGKYVLVLVEKNFDSDFVYAVSRNPETGDLKGEGEVILENKRIIDTPKFSPDGRYILCIEWEQKKIDMHSVSVTPLYVYEWHEPGRLGERRKITDVADLDTLHLRPDNTPLRILFWKIRNLNFLPDGQHCILQISRPVLDSHSQQEPQIV